MPETVTAIGYSAVVNDALPASTDRHAASGAPSRDARRFEFVWLGATFVVLTALAFLFPANGDDWAWGSSIGIDRLNSFFADYNGRNVANLVVLALTRLPWIAPIAVSATVTAMLFLILDISRNRTVWGYAVTTALLLAMPVTLWRQTISWLSGFTNYTLSALLLLVFIRAVQRDWQREAEPRRRVPRMVGIILLGFLAGQFMENVTIFFVIASIVSLITQLVRKRRASLDAWGWVIGFLLGAVAMFSNGAYRRALGGGTASYQHTGLHGAIPKLLDVISRNAVVDNLILDVVLAGAVILLGVLVARRRGLRRALVPLVLIALFLVTAVPLHEAESAMVVPTSWRRVAGVSALLLIASLVAIAFVVSPRRRPLFLGCIGTVLLLIAPLAIVSPIGPRLFLVVYCVTLILTNILLQESADVLTSVSMAGLSAVAAAAALGLLVAYFAVYGTISIAAAHQLETIRAAVAAGETSVAVPRLPFHAYVHVPDPIPGVWGDRYKLYYGLPSTLTITLSK